MHASDSNSSLINPFSTLEEAQKLLSSINSELAERLVLIGGQAMLLWASYYGLYHVTDRQAEAIASDDLDFLGKKSEVIECAFAWQGTEKIPDSHDMTPMSGMVVLNNGGLFDKVDFLSHVYGIDDKQVFRFSDVMYFGENKVKVLSPPLCLKSRIENLFGLGYGAKKQQREVERIQIALALVYLYLKDICETGTVRTLSVATQYIMRQILLSKAGLSISSNFNIDLSQCFPLVEIHSVKPEIASRFLPLWIAKYRARVARRP